MAARGDRQTGLDLLDKLDALDKLVAESQELGLYD
jgi:hypothetical protein